MIENRQFHTVANTPQGRAEARAHREIYGSASDWRERDPEPMIFRAGVIGSKDLVAYGPGDLLSLNIGISVDAVRRQWGQDAAKVYQEGMRRAAEARKQQ